MPSRRFRVLVLAAALVVGLAACTTENHQPVDPTQASSGETTTTLTDTTTTLAGSLDPELAEQLRLEIVELEQAAEEVRGLPFLEDPVVAVLSPAAFAERVQALITEELDPVEVDVTDRLYTLLGLLDPGTDLAETLLALYTEQVAGFYDGETGEMVVAGNQADLSGYQKTVIVHELIHALTDQHFGFYDVLRTLVDEQRYDEASALQALVEGDATYFQLLYMQSLPPGEQIGMLFEALGADLDVLESVPAFLRADLEFPYDTGLRFVQRLVEGGGIAAVDRAYADLPASTEQVLHPQKYEGNEAPRDPAPISADLAGYELLEQGRFGEWELRLILLETLSPGLLTQTTDGWGGDHYALYYDDDDVALALRYVGDSERDAIELAEALLEHARSVMDLGDGVDSGGGKLFEDTDRFFFVDRRGDELILIVSSDPAAGAALRTQLGV